MQQRQTETKTKSIEILRFSFVAGQYSLDWCIIGYVLEMFIKLARLFDLGTLLCTYTYATI